MYSMGGGQPLTNKKAFTLIELLAVIVILAIIALIAVPIIINIVNESKEASNKRSVELYGKAVSNAIAKAQLNGIEVPAGDLSSTFLETVQYTGSRVVCTTNKLYSDGSIYLAGCRVGSDTKEYTYGISQETNNEVVQLAPGLYKDGVMYKSWAELKEENPLSITEDGVLYSWYYDDVEDDSLDGYVGTSIFCSESNGKHDLVIDESINTINEYSLYAGIYGECSLSWESVTIPTSVTTISGNAFAGSGIHKVTYLGTKAQWNTLVPDIKYIYLADYEEVAFHGPFVVSNLTVSCSDGDINYNLIEEDTDY